MAQTLRRRWLGVPLALWASLALVGVAFAGWLLLTTLAKFAVTSQSFGPFTTQSQTVIAGACSSLTSGPDEVTVTWSNVAPGQVCTLQLGATNDGPGGSPSGYGVWTPIAAPGAEFDVADLTCAAAAAPGSPPAEVNYQLRLTATGSLAPNTVYGPFTFRLGFYSVQGEALAACP